VSNGRLALRADYFHVKMRQAGGDRQGHPYHTVRIDARSVEIIEERALLVVIRYQPQLCPRAVICEETNRLIHDLFQRF